MRKSFIRICTALLLMGIATESNSQSWSLTGNAGTNASTNFIGTTDSKPLRIRTNNQNRMSILSNGKIGVGTTAPTDRFEILGGTTTDNIFKATVKYSGSVDVIAVNGISTPSDTSGIGVQGTGNFIGVNGISNLIGINGSGIIGVFGGSAVTGTAGEPTGVWGEAQNGLIGNGVFGFSSGATQNIAVWGIATDTSTTGGAGTTDFAGYFQGNVFGTRYFQASDERVKRDVRPLDNALSRILRVKTATYEFKTDEYATMHFPDGRQTGFLASNLQEIFPDLVMDIRTPGKVHPKTGVVLAEASDLKVVNYMGMIPVLTAALQEQQQQIEARDAAIDKLQSQLSALEARLNKIEEVKASENRSSLATSGAILEQNSPNPFQGMTTIRYELPDNTYDARLVITSVNGQVVRDMSLTGKGKGQVQLQAAELQGGTYKYSLYVNGQMVDTKSLMLNK